MFYKYPTVIYTENAIEKTLQTKIKNSDFILRKRITGNG